VLTAGKVAQDERAEAARILGDHHGTSSGMVVGEYVGKVAAEPRWTLALERELPTHEVCEIEHPEALRTAILPREREDVAAGGSGSGFDRPRHRDPIGSDERTTDGARSVDAR
jgi:hypothetical protein